MDVEQLVIPVSFFASREDNDPTNVKCGWDAFCVTLADFAQQHYPDKRSAPLFSPTIYNGPRSRANATVSALLPVDIDHDWQIKDVVGVLDAEGIEAIVYTSASNQEGTRFRVVVPLAEPVELDVQRRAVRSLVDYLAATLGTPATGVDQGKLSPVVMFYVPGTYASAACNEFHHIAGEVLSAEQWLELYPQQEPERPQPRPDLRRDVEWDYESCEAVAAYRSRSSGRHAALYGMMCSLVMSAENAGYALTVSELADIAGREQWSNRPSSPYSDRELYNAAAHALNDAGGRITDPWSERQPEPPKYAERYRDSIRETAKMVAELTANGAASFIGADEEPTDEPKKAKRKRFFSSRETEAVKPPVWEVKGLIPTDADVAIYGESGALKSFVAYDLASSLAHGLAAFEMLETKGPKPVFYFAGEGFVNLVKKRQLAWQINRGLECYRSENIWFCDGAPSVKSPDDLSADIAEMKRLLDGRTLGCFVIDTLARSLGGEDEDKSSTATRYFDMLAAIRSGCGGGISITVGHFGKDTDRGERGSSNFRASYDVIIWVEKHEKAEDGTHTIQLFVRKLKDGVDGRRYWLQSKLIEVPREDGEDEDDAKTSLVLVPIEEAEGRAILQTKGEKNKAERKQTLREQVESALEILTPGGGYISMAKLVAYLVERDIGSGPHVTDDAIKTASETWRKKLSRHSKAGECLADFKVKDGWGFYEANMAASARETIQQIREMMKS